jgi:hypothetical protein
VRQRGHGHLETKPRDATEILVQPDHFFGDGLCVANQERAVGTTDSIVLPARSGWPSPLLADLGEGVGIARIEVVCRLLCRLAQEPDAVQTDLELLGGVARFQPSLAIKVDEGRNERGSPPIIATISGRPRRPARTNEAGVPPTPTQTGNGFWRGRG